MTRGEGRKEGVAAEGARVLPPGHHGRGDTRDARGFRDKRIEKEIP